ncbi:MAG TPA: hypothetical protein PLQ88_09895, partial [Blastocatellia bacterium]|nr:hypothetical protein [Blastocatellia bacterium]
MAIVIKRSTGLKLLLQAANASSYPPPSVAPLNADIFFQYNDATSVPQYLGTFPVGQKVQIPLATDLDRDVIVRAVSRGPQGQQFVPDLRDAKSEVVESEREQRKPVIGQMGASTYLKAIIGVSYFPRHMRTRRIRVASDAAFTNIIAEWYQDVDRTEAETPRLSEQFSIQRLSPTLGTATYYLKVSHASFSTSIATEATYQGKLEGLRWGPESDMLTVTLADSNGAGGSSGAFNPFTATFQGYGSGASNLLFSVPMPGDGSGGVTGTNNGFNDRLAIWQGADNLTYNLPIFADRLRSYVKANGFTGTVGAINGKVDHLASGSAFATTGNIAASSSALAVPTATDFIVGQGITVVGAGTSGANLNTTVQAISNDGLTLTLTAAAATSVTGAVVRHDDTLAIAAAISAAEAANCRHVQLPAGTYNVRQNATGWDGKPVCLKLTGEVHLSGESDRTTKIKSYDNAIIIDCVGGDFRGATVQSLLVEGVVTAGSNQIGIRTDDSLYALGYRVKRCTIQDTGSDGLFVGKAFSSVYEDLYITNTAGYPVLYDALNMPMNVFKNVYPGLIRDTAPAGFRIKAGEFYGVGCNGVNSVFQGSKIAVIGRKAGVDGDTFSQGAFAEFHHCNFESYHKSGIHCYYNSAVTVKGYSTFAGHFVSATLAGALASGATSCTVNENLDTNLWPSSGAFVIQTEVSPGVWVTEKIGYSSRASHTLSGLTRAIEGTAQPSSHPVGSSLRSAHSIPIQYEVQTEAAGGLPTSLRKGLIDSQVVFADGPELFYWQSSAIHANDIPPLLLEGEGGAQPQASPIAFYYNSTRARREMLRRADGTNPRLEVTLSAGQSYSLANPGTRFIAVKGSGAREIRLPYAGYYQHPEVIYVVDEDSNSAANPITITGNGGTVPVGGAAVLNSNGSGVVLLANPVALRYEIIGTTALPTDLMRFTGGGKTEYLPIFTNDTTITSGPIYRISGDTLVSKHRLIADSDNSFDIGGDGFNRFRNIFASQKFKGPAFVTTGGNGVYGGSGSPEGVQTAEPGSIYLRSDGTWYKKNSGSGNTGWVLQGTGATTTGTGLLDYVAVFTSDNNISNGPIYRSGTTVFFTGNILPQTTNAQDLGSAGFQWRTGRFSTSVISTLYQFPDGLTISAGSGSPEGVVGRFLGSLYLDDVSGTLYRKASGFGTTGWEAVGAGSFANPALS